MATKMLNVRLPETLKTQGDTVLKREGSSPTAVITALYQYLQDKQVVPDCLQSPEPPKWQEERREQWRHHRQNYQELMHRDQELRESLGLSANRLTTDSDKLAKEATHEAMWERMKERGLLD